MAPLLVLTLLFNTSLYCFVDKSLSSDSSLFLYEVFELLSMAFEYNISCSGPLLEICLLLVTSFAALIALAIIFQKLFGFSFCCTSSFRLVNLKSSSLSFSGLTNALANTF